MGKSNNSDAFKIHYDMMTTSGIWPKENADTRYKLRTAMSWILSVSLCITMWMQVINVLNDFAKLSEILYIMVTITATVIKQASFTYQRKSFMRMIEFLKDPVFTSYPDDLDHYMAKTIKYSSLLANTYRYLVMCCVVFMGIYPFLDNKPLPFPFPYDTGRYRYLMYVFQLAGESCCAWNNSCFDTLCTSLMGIGAAQLDILAAKIVSLKNDNDNVSDDCDISVENDEIVANRLKQCVEHHLAIITFIDLIERIFTLGLLSQFLTSVMVICNTLFHFVLISISSQFFMLANYIAVLLTQLFIYCWYGNEIIWKSTQVSEACYMFKWNRCGNKVRKYLFIIMERSKRPLTITTMNISTLSLAAFASILQWSYSCLALLLKMYNKRSLK